jgi:hypothetical protein
MTWQTCSMDPKYEILSEEPHHVRNKQTKQVLDEYMDGNGYRYVLLSRKRVRKQELLMRLHCPRTSENMIQDTINEKKPRKQTNATFEFIDNLPEGSIKISKYGKHEFQNLYFCNNEFYQSMDVGFRKLNLYSTEYNTYYVNVVDEGHKYTKIYLQIYKKMIE